MYVLPQCVDRDYGYVGCSEDVLKEADAMCSGRRKCNIPVPNPLFDDTKPCPNDLKSYFQAQYRCMKGNLGDYLTLILLSYVFFSTIPI